MEACSSAHHWARKLRALGLDARLIAAHFVTPYRMEGKSGKNDANDAAAICEAASRPSMRFVPVKTCEQQGVMSLHRVREGFKEERTACINRIRGVLAEFGLVFGKSPKVLRAVLTDVIEDAQQRTQRDGAAGAAARARALARTRRAPALVRPAGRPACARQPERPSVRPKSSGIGELGASALTAGVGDFKQFKSGHAVRRLAGPGATPGLQRRQDPPGAHHQARRRLPAHAADPGREGGGDDRATRRDDPTSRWLAQLTARVGWQKAVRGHGQQERPHPVGGDDARRRLRPQPRQRQAAGQAVRLAKGRCGTAQPGHLHGLSTTTNHDNRSIPSTQDVLSKMHLTGQTGSW